MSDPAQTTCVRTDAAQRDEIATLTRQIKDLHAQWHDTATCDAEKVYKALYATSLHHRSTLQRQLAECRGEVARLRDICEEATEEVREYANISMPGGRPVEPSLAEAIRQLKQDAGRTRDALIASRDALYVYVTELRQERDDLLAKVRALELEVDELPKHSIAYKQQITVLTAERDALQGKLERLQHFVDSSAWAVETEALKQKRDSLAQELSAYRQTGLTEEILRRHDGFIKIGNGCMVVISEEYEALTADRDARLAALDTREQRANPLCQHVWRAHCEPGSYQAFAVCSICGVRGGWH